MWHHQQNIFAELCKRTLVWLSAPEEPAHLVELLCRALFPILPITSLRECQSFSCLLHLGPLCFKRIYGVKLRLLRLQVEGCVNNDEAALVYSAGLGA